MPAALWALLAVMVGIEAILQMSDAGLIGTPRWRGLAYGYGAFWPGLLGGWQPNYGAQPVLMFATYALLHADLGHLLGNGITLILLGLLVVERVGLRGFWIVALSAALGGALGFWALASGPRPMVGASGLLFGLAGALTVWEGARLLRRGKSLAPVLQVAGGLVALNVLMWISTGGNLAWQAHLAGFLAGAAVAVLLRENTETTTDS